MKFLFLISLLLSFNCLAQYKEPEYAIYFGNEFENDTVTVLVNNKLIAKDIRLKKTMIAPRSLIITQDSENITLEVGDEQKQKFGKEKIKNSKLSLRVSVNGVWRSFYFDLKKGKYLFPEIAFFNFWGKPIRLFTIFQSKQLPIFI